SSSTSARTRTRWTSSATRTPTPHGVTRAALACGDRAHADDHVAAQQTGRLTGRGAVEGLAELELERVALAVDAARNGLRVVAQAHGIDLLAGTMQASATHLHARGGQLVAGADDDLRAARLQHVERLGGGDPEPLALADREVMGALMGPDDLAGARDDL